MGLPRVFRTVQKDRRVVIPEQFLDDLGWKIGEQIVIERHKGKIIIDSMEREFKPIKERLI